MDILKKLFPLSFKFTQDVAHLVIGIIIYVVASILAGVVIGIVGLINLPLLPILLRLLGALIEVYTVGGIVVQILAFTKVLK